MVYVVEIFFGEIGVGHHVKVADVPFIRQALSAPLHIGVLPTVHVLAASAPHRRCHQYAFHAALAAEHYYLSDNAFHLVGTPVERQRRGFGTVFPILFPSGNTLSHREAEPPPEAVATVLRPFTKQTSEFGGISLEIRDFKVVFRQV